MDDHAAGLILEQKYGVTYSSDLVAEMTSRYNLKFLGQ
jgi:hypothetical protein